MTVLAGVSLYVVRTQLEKNYIGSITETLDAHVTGLTYRNSKFMQQMRMYTMSDVVVANGSTDQIVDWLIAHEKIRGGDFKQMWWVDVATGMGYRDNGEQVNVSNTEYYQAIVKGDLGQYISNPVGDHVDDAVFYVCKSVKYDKKLYGFFAGAVSHATLSKAIDAIKIGEKGYAMLLDGNGIVMAFPQKELCMVTNFAKTSAQDGMDGLAEHATNMINGVAGHGWVKGKGNNDLMVYKSIPGTPWSMGLCAPAGQVYATARSLQFVMIVLSVAIALILIVSVAISIFRALKPLITVDAKINEIASGKADLTQRMKVLTNDEIGSVTNGFNTFIAKLQNIMSDIKDSRTQLSDAGVDMHGSIEENGQSISNILQSIDAVQGQIATQAASVDETAGAVNEIASNITSLEKMINAQSQNVSIASSAVEQMIGNISSVNNSVTNMASSFDILEQSARSGVQKQTEMNERIEQIKTQSETLQEANVAIAAIASQTNLLAMNAAIEAAHAGEAGKGFAVVADEIRKLSETSTAQSKTIGEQLGIIKDSIGQVVDASVETSAMFNAVSDNIRTTDELVRQIKNAMEEQQEGSKQIVEALHNMSDSTMEVKSASAEMSEGNKAILEEVRRLKDATTVMKSSVVEMSGGAKKISETGSALSNIADKMRSSINQIGSQIDAFQV
ncbi:MAG: methyl-accepting chemotaxis protein [Treponema sp.]|nr:methyl-accepting chemotaxis protein [Treponema sp.]